MESKPKTPHIPYNPHSPEVPKDTDDPAYALDQLLPNEPKEDETPQKLKGFGSPNQHSEKPKIGRPKKYSVFQKHNPEAYARMIVYLDEFFETEFLGDEDTPLDPDTVPPYEGLFLWPSPRSIYKDNLGYGEAGRSMEWVKTKKTSKLTKDQLRAKYDAMLMSKRERLENRRSQADTVIEKFGGVQPLIEMARSVDPELSWAPSTIYRWTYPKSEGGTGGIIPPNSLGFLMRVARIHGIRLVPEDFYPEFFK